MKENENCTYLYDATLNALYISLSFENLNDLDNCQDWFVVYIDEYKPEHEDDYIQNIIDLVKEEI